MKNVGEIKMKSARKEAKNIYIYIYTTSTLLKPLKISSLGKVM